LTAIKTRTPRTIVSSPSIAKTKRLSSESSEPAIPAMFIQESLAKPCRTPRRIWLIPPIMVRIASSTKGVVPE
jgi:hypothetical protein